MPRPVVIFHPSVAPFVQQAARALDEAQLLEKFYTTLHDRPSDPLQRLATAAARLVGRDLESQFLRRRVTEIPLEKVVAFPTAEIARLVSGGFDRSGRLTDLIWERSEAYLSRRVAKTLSRELKGIYGYEYSSLPAFKRAQELGLKKIYDVPAPDPNFVVNLLKAELDRFPELKNEYTRHTAVREAGRTAHRRNEFELADVVIAASHFTRQSFASSQSDLSKIKIVPYGAPPPSPLDACAPPPPENTKTRFVWAGTFSLRKGAHYLIDAWRAQKLGRWATLEVFGSVTLPEGLTKPTLEGINFHGSISRDDLLAEFRRSDALVFPTLCDGFGLVVTEAWSQGLPVITTARAGAAERLIPRENGYLVLPGDAQSLGETLVRAASRRHELRAMREASLATAAAWQWSDYRRALVQAILPTLA